MAVYDYIWTQEESGGCESPGAVPPVVGQTSTHVSLYTLYLSGLHQRYRHFLRQPNGAIVEVGQVTLPDTLASSISAHI